jgi:trans-aconitate methyltransferase
MSIIWQHQSENKSYKVTQAGNTVRLYRDGVCHSQWNPGKPFQGHLWDLFCLSIFNQPVKNILVLGVGGGTVINSLMTIFPSANVIGIDNDEVHLHIAREYFGVHTRCILLNCDVSTWLKKKNNNIYDVIIDDVFSEKTQVPFRSVNADTGWFAKLLSMLTTTGTLVTNFADAKEWKSARRHLGQINNIQLYECAIARHQQCENHIIHISRRDMSSKQIKYQMQLSEQSSVSKFLDRGVMNYRKVSLVS